MNKVVRYLFAGIFLAFLFGPVSLSGAEPTINITFVYYDITGQTAIELREEMNRNGVLWTNGNVYDAYTGWNVKWNYRYHITEDGCSIRSATATLNVEFKLPRWVNYDSGPSVLKEKWDTYMQSLQQHENGHKDLGLKAAIEIERSMAGLPAAATCDELAKSANTLGRLIISKYAEKETEYDDRTKFGTTQGAVFP